MAQDTSSFDVAHGAQAPVTAAARVFGFRDHAALWFSLGVGLLVMQVGAYLTPALGAPQALLAIVAGSVLGAGLLAWVAYLGCSHGLSSAALIGGAMGSAFAILPVALNIVQLLGWTAFELAVMRDGSTALLQRLGLEARWMPVAITLFWGGLLTALAAGSMVGLVRRFVSRYGLPLVVASLLWLSWHFGKQLWHTGFAAWWARPGSGGMNALQALDLVVAMPVSWLPLVADYARYGKNPGSALRGTWLGYALANLWCYALGVLIMATATPDANLVTTLLLAQGGLIAFGLIMIDEVDNAYGDVHSGAVSVHFLSRSAFSVRSSGMVLAIVATAAALVLPMQRLEPFLLMLSSVFVPLFGVVIAHWTFGAAAAQRSIHPGQAAIWLAGVAWFHLGVRYWPEAGSALPALAFTAGATALLEMMTERKSRKAALAD
ncbi:MAG: cytosine permease [Brachymonas sp.]|nr:cytosine permease [Brachymonas sp.]